MANLNINLRKLAMESVGGSELMLGRTQIDTPAVVNYCKGGQTLTIRDYDWQEALNKETKELQQYPICIFDELEENFYAGGVQLNDLCKAIDAAGAKDALKEEGLVVKFVATKTSSGNQFIKIEVQ